MNIYIDFDDVICETARSFSDILKRMFGKVVPYENIEFFNLQQSFGLSDEDYDSLMTEGHVPEILLAYEETPGAAEVINSWLDAGHNVKIVTGRPFSAYNPSREWLDCHNLARVDLICVDKYGRENFNWDSSYSISLEEFYTMKFDFAVEDSPAAFKHLKHLPDCKVAVFHRPWNQNAEFPNENYVRCMNWNEVDELLKRISGI